MSRREGASSLHNHISCPINWYANGMPIENLPTPLRINTKYARKKQTHKHTSIDHPQIDHPQIWHNEYDYCAVKANFISKAGKIKWTSATRSIERFGSTFQWTESIGQCIQDDMRAKILSLRVNHSVNSPEADDYTTYYVYLTVKYNSINFLLSVEEVRVQIISNAVYVRRSAITNFIAAVFLAWNVNWSIDWLCVLRLIIMYALDPWCVYGGY